MPVRSDPAFGQLAVSAVFKALRQGWAMFLSTRQLSVTYSMVFALIGVFTLLGLLRASYAPPIVPLAGALFLLGPTLLTGFFALADRAALGQRARFSDVIGACARTSWAMLAVALLTTVLFIIWCFDVAMLYGVIVGRVPTLPGQRLPIALGGLGFLLWSSTLAVVLPLLIFAISAFSVPLLYYRRAGLGPALRLSLAAVAKNPALSLVWATMLTLGIVSGILVFPLVLVIFPVLAFASHSLYQELFAAGAVRHVH